MKAHPTSLVLNAVKAVCNLSPSVTSLVVVLRLNRGSIQSVVALKARLSHGVMVTAARRCNVMVMLIMVHAVLVMVKRNSRVPVMAKAQPRVLMTAIRRTVDMDPRPVKCTSVVQVMKATVSADIETADMPSVAHAAVIVTSADRKAWAIVGHHLRDASSTTVHHRRWSDVETRSVLKDRISTSQDHSARSLARVTAASAKRAGEVILDITRCRRAEMEHRVIRGR